MPGLVGIVDPGNTLGAERINQILTSMCDVLKHSDSFHLKIHQEHKLAIGKINKHPFDDFPVVPTGGEREGTLFPYGEVFVFDNQDVLGTPYHAALRASLSEDPPRAARAMDGQFLMVFHDPCKSRFTLINDTTTSIPLFYLQLNGVFYFAPEVKALLRIPGAENKVNRSAIAHFLSSGMSYLDETYFDGIRSMNPATTIEIGLDSGRVDIAPYWSFTYSENVTDKGRAYYQDKLAWLINKAVQRRTRDHQQKRIGAFLSGGYDSRTLLAACLDNGVPIETITHGVNRDKPLSDALIAWQLSDQLGVPNHFYPLEPGNTASNLKKIIYLSDGLTDQIGNYLDGLDNYNTIASRFDIMLRGEEIFGWDGGVYGENGALATFGMLPLPREYRGIVPERNFSSLKEESIAGLAWVSSTCPNKDIINRKDFFIFKQGIPNFWARLNHIKQNAIDVRTPLMDKEILEFMSALPPRYRLYRNLFRSTVIAAFPRVFQIESAKVSNLPNWTAFYREHQIVRDFMRDSLLNSPHPFFDELFSGAQLKILLDNYEQRMMEKKKAKGAQNVKAFQTSGISRFKGMELRSIVTHMVNGNHALFRLAYPLLKLREKHFDTIEVQQVIMRIMILNNWCHFFLK